MLCLLTVPFYQRDVFALSQAILDGKSVPEHRQTKIWLSGSRLGNGVIAIDLPLVNPVESILDRQGLLCTEQEHCSKIINWLLYL